MRELNTSDPITGINDNIYGIFHEQQIYQKILLRGLQTAGMNRVCGSCHYHYLLINVMRIS